MLYSVRGVFAINARSSHPIFAAAICVISSVAEGTVSFTFSALRKMQESSYLECHTLSGRSRRSVSD